MAVEQSVQKTVVLGLGGTIAGVAADAGDNLTYQAARLGVEQLLQAAGRAGGRLAARAWEAEQLAQIDSKDMDFAVWQQLVLRVCHLLAQPDVQAVVITHGTDTLEETAFFLQEVLPAALCAHKPVVLTCAMRPATSLMADGPQNLLDALALAATADARGVLVVCAGTIHRALDVQKVHPYRLDAFSSGEAGPVGFIEEGVVRLVSNWADAPVNRVHSAMEVIAKTTSWPRVEMVVSHAGASGAIVDALLAQTDSEPLRGLVVAGTGNGTVHHALEAALARAQAAGVTVWRTTRCALGRVVVPSGKPLLHAQGLPPVKARVALMLALMTLDAAA